MMLNVVKNCLLYSSASPQISLKSHRVSARLYLYFAPRHSIANYTSCGSLRVQHTHICKTCNFSPFLSPPIDPIAFITWTWTRARARTSSTVVVVVVAVDPLVLTYVCIGPAFRIEYTHTHHFGKLEWNQSICIYGIRKRFAAACVLYCAMCVCVVVVKHRAVPPQQSRVRCRHFGSIYHHLTSSHWYICNMRCWN